MAFVKLGTYNKNYKYIILSILFLVLKDVLTGYNCNDSFITVLDEDSHGTFAKHNLINHLFCYIGTFILSLIYYIEEKKYYKKDGDVQKISNEEEEKKLNNKELLEGKIVYIHYERRKNFTYSKYTFYFFLFLICLWIVEDHLNEIFIFLKDLDFWAIEIIITSLLNSKMFHLKIFRHHILVYFINFIPIILKIFPIILSFNDEGNQNYIINNTIYYEYCYNNNSADCKNANKDKLKNLYVIYWWLVPVGIITYLFLITLRAFVNSKLKWFMDLKYMSANKLLMIYGFLGTILCSIVCTFTTFVECEKTQSNNKSFYDYICLVHNNNTDGTNSKYFDSFYIYFKNFNPIKILKMLCIVLFFFYNKYYYILIIKFFTPVHLILSIPAYFIIH